MKKPRAWSKAAKEWVKGPGRGVAFVANIGLQLSYDHTSAMMRGVARTTEKTAETLVKLSGLKLEDFGQAREVKKGGGK